MTSGRVIPTLIFAGLLSLLASTPTHAQVTTQTTLPTQTTQFQNIAVSGASNYDATTTPSTPIIIGGYTGPYGDCASSPAGICDACAALTNVCDTASAMAGTLIYNCAERSITPQTPLTISFTAPANAPANGTAVLRVGAQTTNLALSNVPVVNPNATVTVVTTWGTLCGAESGTFNNLCTLSNNAAQGYGGISDTLTIYLSDASNNLTVSQQFTLKISYIDAQNVNGTANTLTPLAASAIPAADYPNQLSGFEQGCDAGSSFCDFSTGSGDSKVYINGATVNSLGPADGSGIRWANARMYFAPYGSCNQSGCTAPGTDNGFCQINLATSVASSADLVISNETATDYTQYSLSSTTIKGLQNDQPYVFMIASQDQASIVSGFQDSGAFLGNTGCTSGTDFNLRVNGSCPYIGFPGKVVGLLSDQKCFIATAAFGSPMEPHVMVLRHFRNRFLLSNKIGKWFVDTYYHFSPPMAQWISEHETMRAIARTALWPAVWFAEWMTGETAPDPLKVKTTTSTTRTTK